MDFFFKYTPMNEVKTLRTRPERYWGCATEILNRIDNDFTVYRFTASPLSVKFGKPEFEGKVRTQKEAFKISPMCSFSDPTCQNIKQIVFVVVLAAFKSIL